MQADVRMPFENKNSCFGYPDYSYNSLTVAQDGEGDDLHLVAIVSDALKNKAERPNTDIKVFCSIGNEKIVHCSADDKQKELMARVEISSKILGFRAEEGAPAKNVFCPFYVRRLSQQAALEHSCLVLHTESFKSLQELFQRQQDYQREGWLQNVTIITYGSVNVSWALKKSEDEPVKAQDYQEFYKSLNASGAKLLLVEAFPFLDTKNKITHKNTPVTYSLLKDLDGPAGKEWVQFNARAAAEVRYDQAKKVVNYILQGLNKASEEERGILINLLSNVAKALGGSVDGNVVSADHLVPILMRVLVGEAHDQFDVELKNLSSYLISILADGDEEKKKVIKSQLDRPFNIYSGTVLEGQVLIADQIPAIIFAELVEGRKNGIGKDALPVTFEGLNPFAVYTVTQAQTSLYYLDTKVKAEQSFSNKDQLINSYLKYIDLCMTVAFLSNDQMITDETRERVLSSSFKEELSELASEVQLFGYDLPKSYEALFSRL